MSPTQRCTNGVPPPLTTIKVVEIIKLEKKRISDLEDNILLEADTEEVIMIITEAEGLILKEAGVVHLQVH
jgi:hypothetical protein